MAVQAVCFLFIPIGAAEVKLSMDGKAVTCACNKAPAFIRAETRFLTISTSGSYFTLTQRERCFALLARKYFWWVLEHVARLASASAPVIGYSYSALAAPGAGIFISMREFDMFTYEDLPYTFSCHVNTLR